MSDEIRPFLKKNFAGIVEDTLASLRSGVGGRVVLDDGTEGSVLRTLVEAFGRELAVCYEQLEAVYMAGYLDTATGPALDRVVELLGISRHQAGWLEGDVVFSRQTPAPYDVDIPGGTLVAGKGVQGFETVVPAVLREGETSVRVPVRSLVAKGDQVEPGKLSLLNRPIPAIEAVTNPAALLPRREPETDDDLRQRARSAIRGGRTATTSAIERAVRALGIVEVVVVEDVDDAGLVKVVIGDVDLTDAELEQARLAIEEVRPVGVRIAAFRAQPVWIVARAVLELDEDLDAQSEAALRSELEGQVAAFFDALGTNETVRWNKLRNLLAAHPAIAEVRAPGQLPGQEPLSAVDREFGSPEPLDLEGNPRLLGTPAAPIGVFINNEERARLHAVELDLQAPELPVWIDVELDVMDGTPTEKIVETAAALRAVLEPLLPDNALVNPLTLKWDQLSAWVAEKLPPSAPVSLPSMSFSILFSRDGRVATLAGQAPGSEEVSFAIRERLTLRNVLGQAPQ
ncbi:MAG: baseplate J/gp47 family protein [Myxococcales bacterium]|nr:baseplate J/gp47 family protein [Myxococcales bacterium]